MNWPFKAFLLIAIWIPAIASGNVGELFAQSEERTQKVSPSIPVANGKLVVISQTGTGSNPSDVMIHFHGAIETVQKGLARSSFPGTLVVVNFPGLSAAYSKPFADDPNLLDTLLKHAIAHESTDVQADSKIRLSLSSFSAGYGAIREILKNPVHFERVDRIVTADSIYAGWDEESTRTVSASNMEGFLRFAKLSSEGKKTFILSHSAQKTPYASTTETANYLAEKLGEARSADKSLSKPGFHQGTRVFRGKLRILGFEGEEAGDHMQHLHQIDLFWGLSLNPILPPL